MAIDVVPYAEAHVPAVREFNRRMREGGTAWGWYVRPEDEWLPPRPGRSVWREHYVALEDGEAVRGAYALKPQEWWIHGEPVWVTDWQGPVSEGVIDRRYNTLGLRMMRDMTRRRPLLYSWGHGEDEAQLLEMLRTMGWRFLPTPFCLRILHPFRFLRRNGYLRRSARDRYVLDALAFGGVGGLALKALDAALRFGHPRAHGVDVQVMDRFAGWADAIWERCRGAYTAIGLRDAATLDALMPTQGWPAAIRLRVQRDGVDVGWAAVLDNALQGNPRFGDLRVGTVIDCLAGPEDADDVIAVATRFLAQRGVDILCANQSHPRWIEAFRRSGFLLLRDRRLLAMSPELGRALDPIEETRRGLHLTNLDGHGPRGF